jgi:hypothetical protein
MTQLDIEAILIDICAELTDQARIKKFTNAVEFEHAVRGLAVAKAKPFDIAVELLPAAQAFPDIVIGEYGIEVKFTLNDTWRSVANSVQETNRVDAVKMVFLVFGKMGGEPEVKWAEYAKSVMHVRTSHVPRFEVEMGTEKSLFEIMGISYEAFRVLSMHEKMQYVRSYARARLKKGERLWWLEDNGEVAHSLPIQVRLYTSLNREEKDRLRGEAILLCPQIIQAGSVKGKYDDVVLYMLTYHGVLCHQARDLFSAGSVANPSNDDDGGRYIERMLKLSESHILKAADMLEDSLFVEYWGESTPKTKRIASWLAKADAFAKDWVPSQILFAHAHTIGTSDSTSSPAIT